MATPAMSGGALLETGSHLVDQLLFVLGSSRAVLRDGAQRIHRDIELASSFVADVTVAGAVETPCHVDLTWLEDLCNGIFISFERVTLRVGLDAGDPLTLIGPRGETLCELALDPGADSFPQAIFLEWRDFVQACRSGGRSPLDATTVRATTALIEGCYKLACRRRECTAGADFSVRPVAAAPAVS
jgi:predicted dehydrogenase